MFEWSSVAGVTVFEGLPFSTVCVHTDETVAKTQPAFASSVDDVTKQIAAEAALRQSEEHYRRLFESSHDPVLVLSPEEIILYANDEACRVYGFSRQDLVGLDMKTISLDVAHGRREMERVIRGESVRFESHQRRSDGTVMDLDIRATAIPYRNGLAVLSMNRDVTEERRRDAALRESEERYRHLFDAAPIGIVHMTGKGEILAVNDALVRLLGREDRSEVLAAGTVQSLFNERAASTRFIEALRRDGSARTEVELRRAGGAVLQAEIHARAGAGSADAFVTDITARKDADREREQLVAEIQLLLQSAYEGICAADCEGRCTLVNAAAAASFGLEPAALIGRSLHELTHHSYADGSPFPVSECPMRQIVITKRPVRIEDVFWRSDGTSFPVEVAASPILLDATVRGVVVSFLDITERKATQRQLETAERVAGLGRLAGAIAHEFNNVLMAILPVIEILERRLTDEKLRRLLAGTKASVSRGKRITREILSLTYRCIPMITEIDLSSYLPALRDELGEILGRSVALDIDVAEGLMVAADPTQLTQIFVNIAMNAREAMPDGGTLTIRAAEDANRMTRTFGAALPRPLVHFQVTDTGAGMSANVAARALEPLFTTKRSATGLGLTIAHHIIEDHRGEISIETAPGRGTTVHFFLPAATPPSEVTANDAGEVE